MRLVVVAVVVALLCSGCTFTNPEATLGGAKAGNGTVKRTKFIDI